MNDDNTGLQEHERYMRQTKYFLQKFKYNFTAKTDARIRNEDSVFNSKGDIISTKLDPGRKRFTKNINKPLLDVKALNLCNVRTSEFML